MADEHGGPAGEGTGDREGLTALKEEASEVTTEVREEVKERADRWTSSLGQKGVGMARALEAASSRLREEGDTALADLADRAATRVERMAGYLERENPSGLVDDLEELGRSNPAAFLGGAFVVGVLGGRLLRASKSSGNGMPGGDRDHTPGSEARGGAHGDVHGDTVGSTGSDLHGRTV